MTSADITVVSHERLANAEVADRFVDSHPSDSMKVALRVALNLALVRTGSLVGTEPDGCFDLLYYVRSVEQMLEKRHILAGLLSGELRAEDVW
jgi:hypothetical protein